MHSRMQTINIFGHQIELMHYIRAVEDLYVMNLRYNDLELYVIVYDCLRLNILL